MKLVSKWMILKSNKILFTKAPTGIQKAQNVSFEKTYTKKGVTFLRIQMPNLPSERHIRSITVHLSLKIDYLIIEMRTNLAPCDKERHSPPSGRASRSYERIIKKP